MEMILPSGAVCLIDKEDYEQLPVKTGWYEVKEKLNNARTSYVTHDKYGKLHRFILKENNPKIIIDHIDRNGLNNQKNNLRRVSCSENKRNQSTISVNKFNFNGLSYERPKNNRAGRVKVVYSTNDRECNNKFKSKSKSFGNVTYKNNYNLMVRDAVLYRISKMREFGYIIDERSETIEKKCLQENYNMEEILGINFQNIFE